MTTTCVVQARIGSTRLPGKVLADVGGEPMLGFLLRRLSGPGLPVDHLVVATTEDPADDAVEAVARTVGCDVVRGPDADVLARFALALDGFPADTVVRLTADCPLADPDLVGDAMALREETGADYVSNTLVRTYPDGLDVEVVAADALRTAHAESGDPVEREHVTPFVYRRPERFRLAALRHDEPLGDLRWTVDTEADLAFVRSVVERVGGRRFSWRDVLAVAGRPPLPADGFAFRPAIPGDGEALLALRNDPDSVRWSLSPRRVTAGEHAAWFSSVLHCPATRVWVAIDKGRPVGEVRIDVECGFASVSVAVDGSHRGRGLGTRMLSRLFDALEADQQVHTLTAAVHPDNEPSRRLFERAGLAPATAPAADGPFLTFRRPLHRGVTCSNR